MSIHTFRSLEIMNHFDWNCILSRFGITIESDAHFQISFFSVEFIVLRCENQMSRVELLKGKRCELTFKGENLLWIINSKTTAFFYFYFHFQNIWWMKREKSADFLFRHSQVSSGDEWHRIAYTESHKSTKYKKKTDEEMEKGRHERKKTFYKTMLE